MKKTRRVDPKYYTKDYYLNDCTGFDEFKNNYGEKLEPRLDVITKEVPWPKSGQNILDIGCGRGEIVLWASELGANGYGIDYSKDAIKLANEAYKARRKQILGKVKFLQMDAKEIDKIPVKFDAIYMTEVLEHLYPEEQDIVLKLIKKKLKKDGFLFVHTSPSKTFIDLTYRLWTYPVSSVLVSLSNFLNNHNYGNIYKWSQLRTDSHKIMHVNEPDYFSLKNIFERNGFYGEIKSTNVTFLKPIVSWKDRLFNFFVYLDPMSKKYPLNVFWGSDFNSILRIRN